jgi:hypothetical protein
MGDAAGGPQADLDAEIEKLSNEEPLLSLASRSRALGINPSAVPG